MGFLMEYFMHDIKDLIEVYQESMLNRIFGSIKWENNKSDIVTPWHCPKCDSNKGFRRRGSRTKKVYYNNQKVDVKLFQVTCLHCDSTFSPFPQILGLEKNERLYSDLFDLRNLKSRKRAS